MTASAPTPTPYIVGLDLGANSCGWAVFDAAWNEAAKRFEPIALTQAGSRVFEAGVDGDISKGRDESRAVARRIARGARRRGDRLSRRVQRTYTLLEQLGLLPVPATGSASRALRRDHALKELDRGLLKRWMERLRSEGAPGDRVNALPHVLPYLLRARGLDEQLAPEELGRAIYHIAQRRGFKSNRKDVPKDAAAEKEEGAVKEGIKALRTALSDTGARTYGEYFAVANPFSAYTQRIRGRYTARAMFEEEFDMLWAKQASFDPARLTDAARDELREAIFFQRPLKSAKHLIGRCDLEPNKRRAPIASLDFQHFRVLQKVNDLRIAVPNPTDARLTVLRGETGALTPEERTEALRALEFELDAQGNLKLTTLKKLLKLPKGAVLNFDSGAGDEKSFPGLRTQMKLRGLFGERWDTLLPTEQEEIVDRIIREEDEDALVAYGAAQWELDEAQLDQLRSLRLEPDYCNLSRKALRKLLPLLEEGVQFATARKQIYGDPTPLLTDSLLPLNDWRLRMQVRNPAVERALTELRKVVNALVREYGKPAVIRIEFGRDLKQSRKARQEIDKRNRDNEKERRLAAERIIREAAGFGNLTPDAIRRSDIERALLWEECGGICPYTGMVIPFAELFSTQSRFDIEHIIPYSRSLDDSFMNKTLCLADENRQVKKNRTPFEAYAHDETRFGEILDRIYRFKDRNGSRRRKYERFILENAAEAFEDFSSRQLNDSRYIARLARQYLGSLYGCDARGFDSSGTMRITVTSGGVTAALRREWHLNRILSGTAEKTRDDHRHHALDAAVVAVCDAGVIQRFAREAREHESKVDRWWKGEFSLPFDGFEDQLREALAKVVVSHRVNRRVSGPLHEETLYAPPRVDKNGKSYTVVRKPVQSLTSAKDIVDDEVRRAVERRVKEVGGFKELEGNWPYLTTQTGEVVPIKKVRIRRNVNPVALGREAKERWVLSGSNHHMEILEVKDKTGNPKWEGVLVPMMEAYRRVQAGEPVVQREHGPDKTFVMSVSTGDILAVKPESDGRRRLYRVRTISVIGGTAAIWSVPIEEARKKTDIPTEVWLRKGPETLRKINCRKVMVDALGRVRAARD